MTTRRASHAAHSLYDAACAGGTILAPNTELATALFDAVERMHVAAGHRVWPTPIIRDFGGWLRELHVSQQLADATLPRALSDVEERELWREVVLDDDRGGELLEPDGAARSARRARRIMAEHDMPLEALAAHGSEEGRILLAWNEAFERRCREHRCVAAHHLLDRTVAPGGALLWIESPVWRPAARRWLAAQGAARVLPPRIDGAASVARVRAASGDGELAEIAAWARAELEADPGFRAWICVPDLQARRARLQDAFDAALAPRRFAPAGGAFLAQYAVAGGTPLADYAPVRAALQTLAAAAGPVSFEEFSVLLCMPELQPAPADEALAARVDVLLREHGPSEASLGEWLTLARRLAAGLPPVAAVVRLAAVLRILEAARGSHPMSRWVSTWVEAFEAGPWSLRERWSSTEFQSVERFRDVLVSLAAADELLGARSAAGARRILQGAARDTAFQPQTGVPAIWVTGRHLDPWLSYDGLWVAGCSAERWPPPPDPVPLLPVRLQREYGVVAASAEAQLDAAEDLQRRWCTRAAKCNFSCADSAEGVPAAFGALLPHGALRVGAAVVRPLWHALAERSPPLESLWDEDAPAYAGAEPLRGVATLRGQSLCAFRGFAETRLAADPLERPVPGFNARERGIMLHDAIEQVWSVLRTSARLAVLPPEERDALVMAAVERAIARQSTRRDPGERWRRREAPRLAMLLGRWLETELQREPFEVESLEAPAAVARHGGLEFRVRIDRSDRLSDGSRVLIDYKTGSVSADWRGPRPDNPQLPIYALLRPEGLVAVAYGQVNAGGCCFVAETARSGLFKARGRPSSLEGMPDFAALLALWASRIETIAAEFASGRATVTPKPGACTACGLQSVCRIPAGLDRQDDADD